ncbi:MAG: rod shape-determining protein RodA [Caulobacterales bacterium]
MSMPSTASARGGFSLDDIPERLSRLPWTLILVACIITAIGTAMLYSVAPGTATHAGGWTPWAGNHLLRFMLVFPLMLGAAILPLGFWRALAAPLYLFALLLLVAVEVNGETILGATRWLRIGPLQLQPSEFMKIGLLLALAAYFHAYGGPRGKGWFGEILSMLPPILMIAAPATLVMHQPDLGTAILLILGGGAVMFLAGLKWRYIVFAALVGAAIAPLAYFFVLHDYQRQRLDTFVNPELDPLGAGYHVAQSKIAIGSGGFEGKGFMQGSQGQLDFLPEKQTDFIFTIIGEEFGFVGTAFVVTLFAVMIALCLSVAQRSRSAFGKLAAGGVTAMLATYVFINAGMVMGLMPVVGVPLPLISNGGTAMITVMAGLAIVLNVHLNRDQKPSAPSWFDWMRRPGKSRGPLNR